MSQVVGQRTITLALIILPLAAIANIIFFAWSLDDRPLVVVFKAPQWMVLALIFSFLPWITNSLRLLIWSRFFQLELSAKQAFRVILGTVLGNAITPTATGATAVKWAFLVNEDVDPDKATTLIGLQVAEDSIVSTILLALALLIALTVEVPEYLPDVDWATSAAGVLRNIAIVLAIGFAGAILILMALLTGMLGKRAKAMGQKFTSRLRLMLSRAIGDWKFALSSGRKYLLATITLTVIQWTTRHSIALLIIGFVGGKMMPMLHWALQWLVITASSIIPSPGGAGGTEASFLIFFAPFVPESLIGLAMVIWRVVIFYIPVMVAALFFLALGWHKPLTQKRSGPD